MKPEHEMLKEICDVIWYDLSNLSVQQNKDCWYAENTFERYFWDATCDVREIIFTQEFMDKFITYYDMNISPWIFIERDNWELDIPLIHNGLLRNLDNPTEYLYNLLELWQKQEKN